ncbi:electron transport complex subunit RsxC [Natranaerobius trueperi]|uniref:Ion-translocating oxidoreductase complex subunit C n=1 Tax=Natranaerobius trueperi TaxID=759412 RepID=A0A226BXF9_9FIRM|nr:electron transport complex subunit RsxC [Natranaerobius trueperi]OWZ83676.1 electron transport complex subunit RsxC [Natranaerobius trueperi]
MEVKSFVGGAYIPHYKEFTEKKKITNFLVPERVVIPLSQHIGAHCESLVQKGDKIKVGDKIGDSDEYISAPVHSSVTGVVEKIEKRPIYDGSEVSCVVVKTSKEQEQSFKDVAKRNIDEMNIDELKKAIKEAGIVGMGGASFPTYVQVNQSKKIDTLIINGAECEPFLTCDHRQMAEYAKELVKGAKIMAKIIEADNCYFGIEVNKPDAIEALNQETKNIEGFEVVPLDCKFPQGYKTNIIKAVTGRDVPRGARSAEIGCLVRNVGTTVAIYEACAYNKPLYERVVTVTGPKVKKPGNYIIRVGTPVKFILEQVGVEDLDESTVVMGGPMTGAAQSHLDAPVVKNTTGVIVLPSEISRMQKDHYDCVRCGKCVEYCPMHLYPNKLSIYAEADMFDECEKWNVTDCAECGLCAFVCPSYRPIIKYIQKVKPIIKKKNR